MTRHLFEQIASSIPESAARFLDPGIYSPNHMLRIYKNYKAGTARLKRLLETYCLRGIRIKMDKALREPLAALEASLITWTFECRKLQLSVPEPERTSYRDGCLSEAVVDYALSLLASPDEALELGQVEGRIIGLKRNAPSFCPTCRRVHEHENPYLLVDEKGKVTFFCRRSKAGTRIGQLPASLLVDQDLSDG